MKTFSTFSIVRDNCYFGTLKEIVRYDCFFYIKWYNKFIYIDQFSVKETKKYIKLLISLINKITLCKLIKNPLDKNSKLIKFKKLQSYSKNLVLLSFIRYLWQEPCHSFSKYFFEALKQSDYKDPFERLTYANKKASDQCNIAYYQAFNHSNASNDLKIKNIKEFLYSCNDINQNKLLT